MFGEVYMVQRPTVLVESMCFMVLWNPTIMLTLQRSCLHGFWNGRTSPEDIQAMDGMSSPGSQLAYRTMQKMQPWRPRNANPELTLHWLLADQHAAQLNST